MLLSCMSERRAFLETVFFPILVTAFFETFRIVTSLSTQTLTTSASTVDTPEFMYECCVVTGFVSIFFWWILRKM